MKKIILLALVFSVFCIFLFIVATNLPFAVVRVVSEDAYLAVGEASTGSRTISPLEKGDILIVFDCDVHDWRKARNLVQFGSINLRDVELVIGNYPACIYIPESIPPDIRTTPIPEVVS